MAEKQNLIFISYRREDSADVSGRIYDRLVEKFGREAIFKDVDTIPIGVDFRKHLNEAVGQCSVLLAVIGRQWLNVADEQGNRRLDNSADFVRIEIEAALQRTIPVVPLLVHGVSMPKDAEMPPSLEDLAYRNGQQIRADPDFHRDMDRLIRNLGMILEEMETVEPAQVREADPAPTSEQPDIIKITSPLEMELVRIPEGEFLMGSTKKDELAKSSEMPQHQLHLPEYFIAKTPVTNTQYQIFVAAANYGKPSHWKGGIIPSGKENHPVVNVNLSDAVAFCQWLSEQSGKDIQLPNEAEWEKAARGTEGLIYPWGNEWNQNKCNTYESESRDTTPVGKFSPAGDSPFGCVDMVGNVFEWTRSLWGKKVPKPEYGYPYDPTDGRENLQASENIPRVLRGGSWDLNHRDARCAFRRGFDPDFRWGSIGFRVVVSPGSM